MSEKENNMEQTEKVLNGKPICFPFTGWYLYMQKMAQCMDEEKNLLGDNPNTMKLAAVFDYHWLLMKHFYNKLPKEQERMAKKINSLRIVNAIDRMDLAREIQVELYKKHEEIEFAPLPNIQNNPK